MEQVTTDLNHMACAMCQMNLATLALCSMIGLPTATYCTNNYVSILNAGLVIGHA